MSCKVQFVCETNNQLDAGICMNMHSYFKRISLFKEIFGMPGVLIYTRTQIQMCCIISTSPCILFLSNVHINDIFYTSTPTYQDYYDLLAHELFGVPYYDTMGNYYSSDQ